MTRFVDKYLSSRIQGYPVSVSPVWSTAITQSDSGYEQANQLWADPLRDINIGQGVRDMATFAALRDHFLVMAGPAKCWPWRDPTDFASVELPFVNTVPTVTRLDQPLGIGDGVTTTFQLAKTYDIGSPAEPYVRPIHYPVVSTVLIGVDGVAPGSASPPNSATVSREGGIVTFSVAPAIGSVLTWGGLFDISVRFVADDAFESIMRTFNAVGFADIPLRETPYCED